MFDYILSESVQLEMCSGLLLVSPFFLTYHKNSIFTIHIFLFSSIYRSLVIPYDIIELGQHVWRHQAITWTNVDLSSMKSSGIHPSEGNFRTLSISVCFRPGRCYVINLPSYRISAKMWSWFSCSLLRCDCVMGARDHRGHIHQGCSNDIRKIALVRPSNL